jgi:hypothetical protein
VKVKAMAVDWKEFFMVRLAWLAAAGSFLMIYRLFVS